MGVVPLYFASGASSASQRAIGTSVLWGMLVGTFLAVFFVPVFYSSIRSLFSRHKKDPNGDQDQTLPIAVNNDGTAVLPLHNQPDSEDKA